MSIHRILMSFVNPFSNFRRRYRQAVLQADAVNKLQQLQATGGTIQYCHEWDYHRDCFSGRPVPGNAILRRLLREEFYLVPDIVMFWNFQGRAERLSALADLPTVTQVAIVDSPNVDDEIFDILTRLPDLRFLSLAGTSVTANGVVRLAALTRLDGLLVANTNVARSDLVRLRTCMPLCEIDHDDEVEARWDHWKSTHSVE